MNNNFYEMPNDWYSEFNNNFMSSSYNNNVDIADAKTAFERGNLFNNIYEPYKNYKYRGLKPSNKQEEMLFNLLGLKFLLTELNLYLDVNPQNTNLINLYNRYLNEEKKLCMEYENNYGPLTADGINVTNGGWMWNNTPWPWEGTK